MCVWTLFAQTWESALGKRKASNMIWVGVCLKQVLDIQPVSANGNVCMCVFIRNTERRGKGGKPPPTHIHTQAQAHMHRG